MIKCNRCGNMSAAGAIFCQSCGAPLVSKVDQGASPKMGTQDQPELPAWLESLRAGERSAPPASNPAQFSAANFSEEGSLPSWMRAERNESRDNTAANPPVPLRSSAFPGPVTDEGVPPQPGIGAQSLVDQQSLPPWMQEGNLASSAPARGREQSLVQPDDVPEWMKTLQQQQFSQRDPAPSAPAVQAFEQSSPAIERGFSAHDLIDPQSLPSWMKQQGGQAQGAAESGAPLPVERGFSAHDLIDPQSLPSWMKQQGGQIPAASSSVPPAPFSPGTPANPAMADTGPQPQLGKGFSAHDLIDPQSLPSWMKQPQQGEQGQPTNAGAAPTPPSGMQNGFSASSLLDTGSLPQWLREAGQEPQSSNPSSASWQAASSQPSSSGAAPGGIMSASSFIDANALPEWLRRAGSEQGSMAGMPGPAQPQNPGPRPSMPGTPAVPGTPIAPPRVENVRVPSRPRHDLNSNENSEMAANVFASMLGVAPVAPTYQGPGQGQATPYPQAAPYQQANPANPPSQAGGPLPGYAGPGAMPNTPPMGPQQQGYAPNPSSSYTGYTNPASNPASYSGIGNAPYTGAPAQQAPANAPRTPTAHGTPEAAGEQKSTRSGKRGFLDYIREWFDR